VIRRVALAAWVALLASCTDGAPVADGERFASAADGFSCEVPAGWVVHHDRGAVLFTSTADPRRTIAVRSVTLEGARTVSVVARDTETVLRGLPAVTIQARRPYAAQLSGTEFLLTFAPPNASARYARRHFLLAGRHRAFQVFETSPAASRADDAVLEVVASLREAS
jgi:hypothetical protein